MSQKLIHIHAKCGSFEIWEVLPENKAVARLEKIKELFTGLSPKMPKRRRYLWDKILPKRAGTLVVNTGVVNPELPFKFN